MAKQEQTTRRKVKWPSKRRKGKSRVWKTKWITVRKGRRGKKA
jgi:hypothetical protein